MGFFSEIHCLITNGFPLKTSFIYIAFLCFIPWDGVLGQNDSINLVHRKVSLPSGSQKPLSDSLEKIQHIEHVFRKIIEDYSGSFGINGSLQNDVYESIVTAALSIPPDTLFQSRFRLYPFQFFPLISTNPNDNYLLIKGPLVDISQTHTLLPNYKVQVRVDSTGQYYSFADSYGNSKKPLRQQTIISKKTYIESNFNNQIRNTFSKSVLANLSGQDEKKSGAVRLFTASVTTNETFTKIFGGDEVAVDATGNINLSISGAQEKTSNQNSNTGKNSSFTPKFEQRQRFNLRGTIGKKVEILFDQDSEREFDFENNIKITYTGFDDEVLQKLEAGNIDLSLPGTEFVTTGGQNKGLFGIKALFKLANLSITTIASIQNGEKTKLSLKGGALKSERNMKVYDYAKAKFFFLEPFYRDNYENYSGRIHVTNPDNDILSIRVFRYSPNNQSNPQNIQGIAINKLSILTDPNLANLTPVQIDTLDNSQSVTGYFLEVSKDEFFLDDRLGILRMRSSVADGDLLAVTYQTRSKTVGLYTDTYLKLKMLWNKQPTPSDSSWTLELKNVYDFGITGLTLDDAKTLKISYRENGTGTDQTIVKDKNNSNVALLKMLHVDEQGQSGEPDDIVDEAEYGYGLDFANGLLIFPKLRPFDPSSQRLDGFSEEVYPDSLPFRIQSIYDFDRTLSNINFMSNINTFNIYMSSSKKSSNVSLGINILEGSEEVLLNGEKLEKDIGYVIDYFSGNIELLDQRALLPDADIEIKYEQAQLFQINKRTIFGARAEYGLADYGLGTNSFIGTTALFQSQSTINKRVQLGEEPFSNFVWDVNTNLEFNAKFLTKLVNYIPLVSTSQPSRINIRGEYAKIFPNPNTSNGLMKNDENGVAYLDDFEAVKRTFPLGTTRKAWTLSSTPIERIAANRGHLIWFIKQEAREKISLIKTNPTDNVLTLGMALKPKSDDPKKSWGGIIRSFSSSAAKELSESRFIELWVKNIRGTSRINIDLGSISEDQNGNSGEPDREVKSALQIGVTEDQDVGLDGLNDVQEADTLLALGIIPGSTNLTSDQQKIVDSLQILYPWGRINKNSDDPFGDNWNREHAQPQNIKIIENAITNNDISEIKGNGLENNLEDGTTRIGDTEDLNGNGVIDQPTNSYFRYSFSTDINSKDTAFVVGKGKDGWLLYRIPILSPDSAINTPSLQNILNARVWLSPENNSDEVIALQIAEFQFVTSEWTFTKEYPNGVIADPNGKQIDSTDLKKIVEISSISTEEGGEYQKPPGVRIEYVQGQSGDSRKREVKEQSLSLKLNELPAGASAIIVKNISSSDLRNYGKMKMFVHGDNIPKGNILLPDANDNTNISPVNFFFRFGNNSTNYYEIEAPLFAGWAKRNFIEIDFEKITSLKFNNSVTADPLTNTKTFFVEDGKTIRIKGSPTIAGITQLYLGVTNNESINAYTGDVWFDELRLTDANDKPGHAVKGNLAFNIADFASFNGFVQYQTSEFRTIDQRFDANAGNTRSWSINTTLGLQKFYLENWGINLPFTFNISSSQSDPKYLPGNDILVESAKAQNDENLLVLRHSFGIKEDSLDNLLSSDTAAIRRLTIEIAHLDSEITRAENFESTLRTTNTTKGFSLTFSKAKNEKNFWFLRYTIDNISSNFSYNTSEQKNPQFISSKNQTWSSATTYNLAFKRKPFKPLSWFPLSGMPLLGTVFKNIKDTEFNYMFITGVTTDFTITSTKSESVERDPLGNPISKPKLATLSSSRGYGISMSPWQTISSSLGVKYQTDLRGLSAGQILKGVANGLNPFDGFNDFVFESAIDTIKNRNPDSNLYIYDRDFATTNTFNINYNPLTFPFLTHALNYTFSNTGRRQKSPVSIYNESASISRRVQIDLGFSLKAFVSSVKEPFNLQSKKELSKPEDSKKSRRDKFKNLNQGNEISSVKDGNDSIKSNSKTSILGVSKKVGSATEVALKTINDVRFTIGFDNNFQISNTAQKIDPSLQWFGYSTSHGSGFVDNIFSFDLDTIEQFRQPNRAESQGLFNYTAGKSINYGFNYGFNFVYFTVDLRYDHAENRALGSTNSFQRTVTRSTLFPWLKFSPIPMFYDVTIRANNIGRWPIFNLMSGITSNMGLGFTYNSKETENWTTSTSAGLKSDTVGGHPLKLTTITTQQTFPQINYDIIWKGNINQNIVFSNTNTKNQTTNNTSTSNTKSLTTNISYTKRGGFRIPLWFLRKKQIDNEVRVGTVASYTKRVVFNNNKTADGNTNKSKYEDSITWSVEPRVDYSFTKWITGGSFFRYESSKTLRTGKITRFLAGIVINITIGA